MNYFKSIPLLAGFCLLTVMSCQKDNALNQAQIGDEAQMEELASLSRKCASHEYNEELMAKDSQFKQNQERIEELTNRFMANYEKNASNRAVITIPVVVHVVARTAAEDISIAQVESQIAILNKDFSASNSEIGSTKPFVGTAVNCEIQFRLDQIVRKSTTATSFGYSGDPVKKSSAGGSDPVSPSTKLNIWACTLGGGLLGYAQFPGGNVNTDGVVCLNTAFGNTSGNYNLGRTATHEVGHWLNLRHIWGDKRCGDDLVSDTPEHDASNGGCPATGLKSNCQGKPLEMWMNYMDYTYDRCMYMFTAGQKGRMQTALASSRLGYR